MATKKQYTEPYIEIFTPFELKYVLNKPQLTHQYIYKKNGSVGTLEKQNSLPGLFTDY